MISELPIFSQIQLGGQKLTAIGNSLYINGILSGGGSSSINTGNQAWVDGVFGNDSTGIVSRQDKPFLTVSAAVAAITTASSTTPFIVNISPGQYTNETVNIFKSWVFLYAKPTGSFDNEIVTLQTAGGGAFTIPIESGTGVAKFGASGISFASDVTFSAATTRILTAIFKGCTFINGMTILKNGNFLNLEVYDTVFEGDLAHQAGYLTSLNNFFNNLTYVIPQNCPSNYGTGSAAIIENCPLFNGLSIDNASTTGSFFITINTSPNFGIQLSNSGGNVTPNAISCYIDSTSYPQSSAFSNVDWVVNRLSDVQGCAYTPTTNNNWQPIPSEASGALDSLASNSSIVVYNHFTDQGNVTTTETDLYSDIIGAGQLSVNGQRLVASYSLDIVSSATATRRVKVYFAGTVIFDSAALTFSSSGDIHIDVNITRDTTTSVRYDIRALANGVSLGGASPAIGKLTGLTLTGTNILKITGQAGGTGAATNDIVAILGRVNFEPGLGS